MREKGHSDICVNCRLGPACAVRAVGSKSTLYIILLFLCFEQVHYPVEANFLFPAYFRLSPLLKHVRKVVGGFGKKSSVSTGVRNPGNT